MLEHQALTITSPHNQLSLTALRELPYLCLSHRVAPVDLYSMIRSVESILMIPMSIATGIRRASDKGILSIGPNLEAVFLDHTLQTAHNEAILVIESPNEMPLNCFLMGSNQKYMASEPSGNAIFNRELKNGWEIFQVEFTDNDLLVDYGPDILSQSPFRLKDCHANYALNGELLLFSKGSYFFSR